MFVHSTIDQPLRNAGFDQTWGPSIFLFTTGASHPFSFYIVYVSNGSVVCVFFCFLTHFLFHSIKYCTNVYLYSGSNGSPSSLRSTNQIS